MNWEAAMRWANYWARTGHGRHWVIAYRTPDGWSYRVRRSYKRAVGEG
jgi:hypothetical protein